MAHLASITIVKLWYMLPFLDNMSSMILGRKKKSHTFIYLVELTSIEKTHTL